MNAEVLTVSTKGQIVLPKRTREKLKFKKGTKLLLTEKEGKVLLTRISDIVDELSEGTKTFIASEKSLAKDWDSKGDSVWDEL